VTCEPEASVAQPGDTPVNTRVVEVGLEVGQDRRGSGCVLAPIEADRDEVAAPRHAPRHSVDALPMDQCRRLVLRGRSEVRTAVVQHLEGAETQRHHGLDGVELQGRPGVHAQKGVLGAQVFETPPCGGGRPSGGSGHRVGGREQRAGRAMAPLLHEPPQRAVAVGQGRGDGRHVAPDGLGIRRQGDRGTRRAACGRRRDGGQDRHAIRRVACLAQGPAVPRCVRHHEDVPSAEVARQVGHPGGALGDGGAGGGRQRTQGFL